MPKNFSAANSTQVRLPRKLFLSIKEASLGKAYDLSVAFVTPSQMRRAMRYKKKGSLQGPGTKKKVSNVLSFPLSRTSGEILICPAAAAPYGLPYLFIHGCLHLKGHAHGATMERIEQRLLKRFTPYAKNSNGDRRRHLPG